MAVYFLFIYLFIFVWLNDASVNNIYVLKHNITCMEMYNIKGIGIEYDHAH